jgi:ATP-dependent helicase/nuclease subunit B
VVHRLWQAWHTQLQAEGLLDPGMALLQRLARHGDGDHPLHYVFAGFDELHGAQLEWIERLLGAGRAHCFLPARLPAADAQRPTPAERLLAGSAPAENGQSPGDCLDSVFDSGAATLPERAAAMGKRYARSPLAGCIRTLAAASAEQEARAIDLQVRRWLIEGHQPIAIVTEDRRLGRRVRALLERAGVSLQDPGGWALSTTSAAAALERWLETVEEDFAHQPLLDVLKSPFTFPDAEHAAFSSTVYRLEKDIVRHENIARGLARYRAHVDSRLEHYRTAWTAATADRLRELLNALDQAADPLRDCLAGAHAPARLLAALRDSLQRLGMWAAFEHDPAGQRILQEWRLLADAARHCDMRMAWIEFRGWLSSALERHDFRPPAGDSVVSLLNLQQAQLGRFAGLVIGACDSRHLPAAQAGSPFFNDRVRGELGLPIWPEHYRLQRDRFRRLLESAPRVLLTWHSEDNGELRTPSPWLAAVQSFQQLAWQDTLHDAGLQALLDHPGTRVAGQHPLPTPAATARPAPSLPAARLPARLSVSAHGDLIDCPYRFFAARGLGLKAREEVRLALEKAGYGTLVHAALEIFHQGRAGFPAPFTAPLDRHNRADAIAQLEAVSRRVFERELEDNYEHRAWLRRWLLLVPLYIEWQIKRQPDWRFDAGEQNGELELATGHVLEGRLDRLDVGAAGDDIIDYKTGGMPKQDAVDSGEAVQLPSYALLARRMPARVEYVKLDNKVMTGPALEGAALAQLTGEVHARLVTLLEAIAGGGALPAWGDSATCKYCDMDGLCRRQAWLETAQ